MSIASCPRCNDQVALPSGASRNATVRCPLCHEEFSFAEILDQLPPALLVVSDPDAKAASSQQLDAEPASDAAGHDAHWAAAPAFSVAKDSAASDRAAAPARPGKPVRRQQQRKPRNPLLEGVKVVLGGFAGLAIAQTVLWWLPASLRQDPLNLGPTVSKVAPWIVPADFRGSSRSDEASTASDKPKSGAKANSRKDLRRGEKLSDSKLPVKKFNQPITLPDEDSGPESMEPAAKQSQADTLNKSEDFTPAPPKSDGASKTIPSNSDLEKPDLASLNTDPLGDLMGKPDLTDTIPKPDLLTTDVPAKPAPVVTEPEKPAPEPTKATSVEPRIKNAPKLAAAALTIVLAEARPVVESWRAAEKIEPKSQLVPSYRTFAKLAEAATLVEKPVPQDLAAAVDLLRSLTRDPQKLELISKAGEQWLRAPKRDGNGVLLVGTVKKIGRQGDLFEMELGLAGGQSCLLYGAAEPANPYPVGAQILASGVIVVNPAQELSGYQGKADSVVWLGPCEVAKAP